MKLFASCPKGLESLLYDELASFGIEQLRLTVAGVSFEASLQQAYHVILWSRLANQLLLQLGVYQVDDQHSLYQTVSSIEWDSVFAETKTFAVKFSGTTQTLKDTRFSALKIKDAIVDQFRDRVGSRPNVDAKNADVVIHARLHQGKLKISVDIAGGSLHRRHYREQAGRAPLKENLAAAVLTRAGWPDHCNAESRSANYALIDPCCGSGTLVIEAALMQADIAPGLLREQQLNGWRGHLPKTWNQQLVEARERRTSGLEACKDMPRLVGFDKHYPSLQKAIAAAKKAGVDNRVHFQQQDLVQLDRPKKQQQGLLVSNLPYGQRLGNSLEIMLLMTQYGQLLDKFAGWDAALLVGDSGSATDLPYRWHHQYQLYNGSIEVQLLCFKLEEDSRRNNHRPGGDDFANRVKKNLKKLKPWIKQLPSDCYRVYDADIPEYAVAVDVYGEHIHVSEYKAPASIDEKLAKRRIQDILLQLMTVFNVDEKHLHLKQRQRQKGSQQYQRQQENNERLLVHEGQGKFLVNLDDFLDTGLFLDHRLLRLKIAAEVKGKSFLNLFCYTATASVHAALAGAQCTSVDMSNTYLKWARSNFRLNNIDKPQHQFIRADITQWLEQQAASNKRYELILLDPPSFSNSKSMEQTFDVLRDHLQLIEKTMVLLEKTGTLYFSNNRRGFKLDPHLSQHYHVSDISRDTIDKDFERRQNIHCCFKIQHKP